MDNFAEHELWTPSYGESGNLAAIPADQYPSIPSYSISCFENSCKLAVIINDIIVQLYSRRATPEMEVDLRKIREKLDNWRLQSPKHLVYDPDSLPAVCCPPHILTQKYVQEPNSLACC